MIFAAAMSLLGQSTPFGGKAFPWPVVFFAAADPASLPPDDESAPASVASTPTKGAPTKDAAAPRKSTARSLLKHARGWAGDDLEDLLLEVYQLRAKTIF